MNCSIRSCIGASSSGVLFSRRLTSRYSRSLRGDLAQEGDPHPARQIVPEHVVRLGLPPGQIQGHGIDVQEEEIAQAGAVEHQLDPVQARAGFQVCHRAGSGRGPAGRQHHGQAQKRAPGHASEIDKA
jgi:hypothetical protein